MTTPTYVPTFLVTVPTPPASNRRNRVSTAKTATGACAATITGTAKDATMIFASTAASGTAKSTTAVANATAAWNLPTTN